MNSASGEAQLADAQVRTAFVWGTFNGATVTLQFSPDGGDTWFDDISGELTFTGKALHTFNASAGLWLRAVITGAGASTNLSCWVY